jgi:hypothetical protein
VDAGDMASDISCEPQPNGERINMGAFGNTAEATVAAHFYDQHFAPAPDINGNGASELVMLGESKSTGKVLAQVYDAKTGLLSKNISYDDDGFNPLAVAVVADLNGNGSSEICLLDRVSDPSDMRVFAHLRDGLTGNYLWHIWFGPKQHPVSLKVMGDINGNRRPELVLMCRDPDNNKGVAKVYDAFSGESINLVWYGPVFNTLGHEILPDMNGNGKPDIALLGINPLNKKVLAHIRDSWTDALLWYIWFGPAYYPIDLKAISDVNGNNRKELALLGLDYKTGETVVKLMDSYSRVAILTIKYFQGYTPIAFEVIPDINGNGKSELAVAAMNPVDRMVHVSIKDSKSGGSVASFTLGSAHVPWGMTWVNDVNGNAAPELSVLTSDIKGFEITGKVRDTLTGSAITDASFDPSFYPWP